MSEKPNIGYSQLGLAHKIKLLSLIQALQMANRLISKNLGDQYVRKLTVDATLAANRIDIYGLNVEMAKLDEIVEARLNEDRKAIYLAEVRSRRKRSRPQ